MPPSVAAAESGDVDLRRTALRKTALILVWTGELWNVLEAAVALWSGVTADSVALIAFGLDSVVELFAGAVLIWHLSREWRGAAAEEAAERRAHRLLGITFFLLSGWIVFQSGATLAGWFPEPQESVVGIVLVIASAGVMSVLYVKKVRIARELRSRALRAEAVETLVCDLQDLTILLGLAANALAGLWWADPVAALALVPFLLREGWEGVAGGKHDD